MPKIDGVGFGEFTGRKIKHLTKILDMHLAITEKVLKKYESYKQNYRYVDLTAGKGFNPEGSKGSPVVFLEQAESRPLAMPYSLDLIECEEKNLEELKELINREASSNGWNLTRIRFHLGQYQNLIPKLFTQLDQKEFGLAYVDPSGDPPDVETLQLIAKLRPKMEILIHVSSTNIKRVFNLTDKLLSDYMLDIGKTRWLVQKPIAWDRHKWTFLLGTNAKIFKEYKGIDFFPLESEEAQEFFPELNLSKSQLRAKSQLPLF